MIFDILTLIWLHWIADFVLQSSWMAQNKSKDNLPLLVHVIVYGAVFFMFGIDFAIINAILHFIIDWFTSRISSRQWEKKEVHNFFVTIGFDQALHYTCLILTYKWLVI